MEADECPTLHDESFVVTVGVAEYKVLLSLGVLTGGGEVLDLKL
jgi:hypothetical protein